MSASVYTSLSFYYYAKDYQDSSLATELQPICLNTRLLFFFFSSLFTNSFFFFAFVGIFLFFFFNYKWITGGFYSFATKQRCF